MAAKLLRPTSFKFGLPAAESECTSGASVFSHSRCQGCMSSYTLGAPNATRV